MAKPKKFLCTAKDSRFLASRINSYRCCKKVLAAAVQTIQGILFLVSFFSLGKTVSVVVLAGSGLYS